MMGLSTASYAADASDIITQQPAGTEQWMHGYSTGYKVYMGTDVNDDHDGFACKFVYAEDGKTVYIKNPISYFPVDAWVKATIEDGVLSIPTPQTVGIIEKDGKEPTVWTINRMTGTETIMNEGDPEGEYVKTAWTVDSENTEMKYTIGEDGVIRMQGDKLTMLGLCADGKWMYYGDRATVYTPAGETEKIVRVPDGAEFQTWSIAHGLGDNRIGHLIQVADVDNTLYIKGFYPEYPDFAVKAYVEGDKVRVPGQQFLGFSTGENGVYHYTYLLNSKIDHEYVVIYHKSIAEDFIMDFDREHGRLTPIDPEMNLVVKAGKTPGLVFYHPSLELYGPTFKINSEYTNPVPPIFPEWGMYSEFSEVDIPFVMIEFFVKPFDVDGNSFDAKDLTYSCWIEDELFTFDAEDMPNYKGLPAPTTELALDFDNNWGMNYLTSIYSHRIQLPGIGHEKYGMQTVYTDPKTGEKMKSKIAYYYPATDGRKVEDEPASVGNIAVDADEVSAEYFDMLGHRVAPSFKGICIKRATYSDGSVRNIKTIKR